MSEDRISTAQAHAQLKQLEACVAALMQGRNLDDGTAAEICKKGPSAALIARLNMSEAVLRAPNLFKNPLTKDLHITGRPDRYRKMRKQAVGEWDAGNTRTQETNLMYPASRPSRPRGPDGGRSFHMSEIIIHPVTKTSTSRLKARHHYTLDASKVPYVEATLGGQHLDRGLYLSRSGVAAEYGKNLLAITSMGPGDDGIVKQWRLIDLTEKRKVPNPIERHLTINLAKSTDPEFWRHLEAEPDVPECLRAFLEAGNSRVCFKGRKSKQVERFLRAHGWHDRSSKKKRADIIFNRGKQPIAQRRLVFELPGSLSRAAIERIIKLLSREFLKRNLPFVLVVHRPNEQNDFRNWHIHLDYHHRPMLRFNPASYEIEPVLPPTKIVDANGKERYPGKKAYEQYCLKRDALANADPSWTGMWDSAIEYEYRTPSGKKKTAFPFVQEIHPDFREEGAWIRHLRTRYADIINAELKRENLPDRFDPRSFEERNIDKIPDVHLSNAKTRFERSGRPTLEGAMNEQCLWNYEVNELRKQFPGGDQPDGDPATVAGFIAGYVELLGARLRSRAEYIYKFATRETNWDSQPEPSATSLRRNKREDYSAERLAKESAEMLSRFNRIWPALTSGMQNLRTRIRAVDSEAPAKKTAVPANQMKPRDAEVDNRASDVRVATVRQGEATDARQSRSQNTSMAPAGSAPEGQSVVAALNKLRAHSIPFAISMGSDNGRKTLVATINQRDAEAHKLPRQIVARTASDRSDLMTLQNERMDARAEAEAKSARQSQSVHLPSSTTSNEAASPAPAKSLGEFPPISDATALRPKSTGGSLAEEQRAARERAALEEDERWMAASRNARAASLARQTRSSSNSQDLPPSSEPSRTGAGNRRTNQPISGTQESHQKPAGDVARAPAPAAKAIDTKSAVAAKRTVVTQSDLSPADLERMATRPIPMVMAGDGKFRLLSINISETLKAAQEKDRHREQFQLWFQRQQDEQSEIAQLFARSSYKNSSQLQEAIKDGQADLRLSLLWARWDGTVVLKTAIARGLEIRNKEEHGLAIEAEQKLEQNRQAAMAQHQGFGF
ncbi:MobA/MobL family protein [Erythrobacter sp.]|jgi:hypothetical protein|uniref:MobA/MobL family protein n=1 Tax=Erythrobacter sp. TaxID=1042 RepID=UPI002E9A37B7|nr:MobA/MobL family protein [Erythrobacter sp.]